MRIKRILTGFIVPAQPVLAPRPPSGPDWGHEIKHDGYRMIVRREGATVRLYSRNANAWTVRLLAVAAAAEPIKAKSFTIDGEVVVLGSRPIVAHENVHGSATFARGAKSPWSIIGVDSRRGSAQL